MWILPVFQGFSLWLETLFFSLSAFDGADALAKGKKPPLFTFTFYLHLLASVRTLTLHIHTQSFANMVRLLAAMG